ncbi:MAG: hypothetical protein IH942_09190 [Acidobacteria bacterium]|nr:hypothetical protein [Acidobacteriota bacterium]
MEPPGEEPPGDEIEPDNETGEQPPPPDELPGDRRTDGFWRDWHIAQSAKGLADILDEPGEPDALSEENTEDLRWEVSQANREAAEAAEVESVIPELEDYSVAREPVESVIPELAERFPFRWIFVVGGVGVLGLVLAVGFFVFGGSESSDTDAAPALTPEVAAPDVEEPGDAASEATPRAAAGEQSPAQAEEGEQPCDAGSTLLEGACVADHPGFSDTLVGRQLPGLLHSYSTDPTGAADCVNGNLRKLSEEELTTLSNPDASTWTTGLTAKVGEALESCSPLRSLYLHDFSQYAYERGAACVADMTNYVLALYTWERLVTMGVFNPDPVVQEAIQVKFDADVNTGYEALDCYAA